MQHQGRRLSHDDPFPDSVHELHHASFQALVLLPEDGVPADEVGFLHTHGKSETRLEHVILVRDVVAEMPEGLLDAAAVEDMEAGQTQIEGPACFLERLEDMGRHLGADIEFPAEFADVADPVGAADGVADLDFPHGSEGMMIV